MGNVGMLETLEAQKRRAGTRVSVPALPSLAWDKAAAVLAWSSSSSMWEVGSLAQLADRLRTGCVYESQPADTFGLLVTRDDPRTRRRARPVPAPIDAHWAAFAPSVSLLTGHVTACGARRCRGVGRCAGQARLELGWDAFAAAYRAELDQWPLHARLRVVRQVVRWLRSYPTVTILSFESGTLRGAALVAWEQRAEFVPCAQRHVFREWLLSLPPFGVRSLKGSTWCMH